MLVSIVPIGNSKGIRIPKAILEQCNIGDQMELEVTDGRIVLEPIHETPRSGWNEAFQELAAHGEDTLLISDEIDIDMDDWEW